MGSNTFVARLAILKLNFWTFQTMEIPLISILISVLYQIDNPFKISPKKNFQGKKVQIKQQISSAKSIFHFTFNLKNKIKIPSKGQENENKEYFLLKYFEIKCSYIFKAIFLQLFFRTKYCQPVLTMSRSTFLFFWYSSSLQARKVTLGNTGLAETSHVYGRGWTGASWLTGHRPNFALVGSKGIDTYDHRKNG